MIAAIAGFIWGGIFLLGQLFLNASGIQVSSGSPLAIVESDEKAIVLELVVDSFELEPVDHDGVVYHRVHIPDAEQTSKPGAPQTPSRGALLGIPTTAGVAIEVMEAEYETLTGYRLYPAPQFTIGNGDLNGFGGGEMREGFDLDMELYATDAFYPGELVELGEVGSMRDQAVAQVQLYPVQYNPVQGEVRVYRRLVARVSWDAAAVEASGAAERRMVPAYEELLRQTLLNYETLARPAASSAVAAGIDGSPKPVDESRVGTALKIFVVEEGLYKLTYDNLLSAGMNPSTIDPRTLRMYNRGTEIAILIPGEADGVF